MINFSPTISITNNILYTSSYDSPTFAHSYFFTTKPFFMNSSTFNNPTSLFNRICHLSLPPSHLIAIRSSSVCFRLGKSIPKLCFSRARLFSGDFSSFLLVCLLWIKLEEMGNSFSSSHLVSGSFRKFLYLFDLELYFQLFLMWVWFLNFCCSFTLTPASSDLFVLMFLG